MEVSATLSRLALFYWRPDFTPAQVRLLMGDFLRDLEPYSAADIAQACDTYRRDPESKFFPTPGALIAILRRYETPPHRGNARPLDRTAIENKPVYPEKPRTVAEILRSKGHTEAADRWENRAKDKRPDPKPP